MDSNTTAAPAVVPLPLLQLDPATAWALDHVPMWVIVVGVVIVVVSFLAIVSSHLHRGPNEGLDQEEGDGGIDGGRAPRQQLAAGEDDAVPVVIICRVDDGGGGGVRGEPTCGVCQAELTGGGACTALSPCRHCFHSTCARDWVCLHATCPLCQAPVAAGNTVVGRSPA